MVKVSWGTFLCISSLGSLAVFLNTFEACLLRNSSTAKVWSGLPIQMVLSSVFIIPFFLTRWSIQYTLKLPHSIILSPLCFTAEIMFVCVLSFSKQRQHLCDQRCLVLFNLTIWHDSSSMFQSLSLYYGDTGSSMTCWISAGQGEICFLKVQLVDSKKDFKKNVISQRFTFLWDRLHAKHIDAFLLTFWPLQRKSESAWHWTTAHSDSTVHSEQLVR